MLNLFSEFFYRWHESLSVRIQDFGGFQEAYQEEKEKLEIYLNKKDLDELTFFQCIYGLYSTENSYFEENYPSSNLFLDYFLYDFTYSKNYLK